MKNILIGAALAGMMLMSAAWAQSADMGATKSGGKAAMCIGCHGIPGYKVAYPHVYHVPYIAGQNPKYLEVALKAYQSGERKHPTMRSIAVGLSDKDITELAAYYGNSEKGAAK
jgi:cytochrome c553